MLAGVDDGAVDFPMEIVRHRHVDGVNLLVGQHGPVIVGALLDGREIIPVPPVQRSCLVANRDDFWPHIRIRQMTPPRRGAGKFPAHQPQPDDSKANSFHIVSVTTLRSKSSRHLPVRCVRRPAMINDCA